MSSSDINTEASSSSSDMKDNNDVVLGSWEEIVIKVPDVLVHLIEPNNSVQLANGELSIVALYQNGTAVAVLARVDDEIQWPLAKDEPVVKLDNTHYFFTLRAPVVKEEDQTDRENSSGPKFEILNYGLTVENKEQEELLKELDSVLEKYSCFSVQSVSFEVESGDERREFVEENSGAYWATLAPNVEEYGGSVAKMIAAGSGQLAKGILWCGDVTVDRLNWGHEFVKKRMTARSESDVRPETIAKIKRVKMVTKMTEEVATGILSGVVKVSGFFTSAIVNSKVGKKFFSLLPGEIVLASLDGFNKVFDAIEHAGRNVMSTSSVVTTGLVTQRYGEQAAKVTSVGLGAAGHVIGTAWAVLKIRKALNPKSVIKPKTLAKAAATAHASDLRAKSMEN